MNEKEKNDDDEEEEIREELNNTIEHAQREHSLSALVIDVNENERTNTA